MMKSNGKALGTLICSAFFLISVGGLMTHALAAQPGAQKVTGIVFHDKNGSGVFDQGDRPLAGIRVSNGREVVETDKTGRYELHMPGDGEVFVIKPRNYQVPLNQHNLPQFYYLHRPQGSPKMRFAGIAPTGPLPASVDFPLITQKEPNEFNVIVFGDPQPRNIEEVRYVIRDAVEELIAEGVPGRAAFGVSLGDIAFDNLHTFEPLNAGIAQLGLPWINVIGNHDCNRDAPAPRQSFETFQRVYGPTTWSFDYGPAHFIVLNSVLPRQEEGRFAYRGGVTERQLAFVANNLKHVPKDRLIVLLMHIPFVASGNGKALLELLQDRPYTLSLSSHTHSHQHFFLDASAGWRGEKPHHHINHGALCGGWWWGLEDEYGIPDATMGDGTPKAIFTSLGSNWPRMVTRSFVRP
jgi:hypothetical protein